MPRVQAQERQRHAEVVVQVAFGLEHRVGAGGRRQDRRHHLLGRGLAVRPGDGDHLELRHGQAMRAAERAERLDRVVDLDDRGVDVEERLAAPARDHHAARPRRHRRRGEVVPVEAVALDRDEQRARRHRAAVDGDRRELLAALPVQRDAAGGFEYARKRYGHVRHPLTLTVRRVIG